MSKELDKLINARGWRKGQVVKLGYQDIEKYAQDRAEHYAAKLLVAMYLGEIPPITESPTTMDIEFDVPEHLSYENFSQIQEI